MSNPHIFGLRWTSLFFVFLVGMMVVVERADAQQHTARRLGHPQTRFAEPLETVEDLRERLTSERLRADVVTILEACDGWAGDPADFRKAAAEARVIPVEIPVGTRLQAMSTRKNGKPVLLKDVLWAGDEPIQAYEFEFYSRGRKYRCITPKPCSNFWVEDAGEDRRAPQLEITCQMPPEVVFGKQDKVCFTLVNRGEVAEQNLVVTVPVPSRAYYFHPTDGSKIQEGEVRWEIPRLDAAKSMKLCAAFGADEAGDIQVKASVRGQSGQEVSTTCSSTVLGIPAILFEVVDLEDPIAVGSDQTYEVRVTNQGAIKLTQVKVVCTLELIQQFVSGTGPTRVHASDRSVFLDPIPELAPKAQATWRVVVKALEAGDVRFTSDLTADQFTNPIHETEATRQY